MTKNNKKIFKSKLLCFGIMCAGIDGVVAADDVLRENNPFALSICS